MLRRLTVVLCAVSVGALTGCVRPGQFDPSVISRYQETMAGRGPQPRGQDEGVGLLQPAAARGRQTLKTEAIAVGKTIETTVTYQVLGTVGERRRVKAVTIIKTTRYVRDPKTGRRTPKVDVQTTDVIVTVRKVPKSSRTLQVIRVGDRTATVSLAGDSKSMVHLTLEQAIVLALLNNVNIRVISFDPAISRERLVQAAAEFDYLLSGDYSYDNRDVRPANVIASGRSEIHTGQVGLSQKAVTGAVWSFAYDLTRTWDRSSFSPLVPRYETQLLFNVTQPLLRGGWPEFNLAGVRIARLDYQTSIAAFRQGVEDTITQVITTFWRLVQSRKDVRIQDNLLRLTEITYKKVKQREGLDATAVEINQSKAAAKSRLADLIVSQKTLIDVQEDLARLLADPRINALTNYEIIPGTEPMAEQVQIDVADQLVTALRHSPVLEQARLAIAAAKISVRVAKNQVLPQVDLSFSLGFQGLARGYGTANDIMFHDDFINYGVALAAEYPIGNRARIAALREARLERMQAVSVLQDAADQIATQVKERIRQIETTYRVLVAQRAAAEAVKIQLRALEDTERIRGRLTPEFLQVKLAAQAQLAFAQRAVIAATVDYNVAMTQLAQITGTVLEMHRVKIALPDVLAGPDAPGATSATRPINARR